MLERDLFGLVEQTADAAYTVTEGGEIVSWNAAAEQMFGYAKSEVLGRNIEEVTGAPHSRDRRAREGNSGPATRRGEPSDQVPDFDVEVHTRSGKRRWVNVSTIVFDDRRSGRRLFVHLARDVEHDRRNAELIDRMLDAAQQLLAFAQDPSHHAAVEALSDQERRILTLLAEGRSSAAIAAELSISTQTIRNHLHHINRKLRTHNRLEAVTHAQRRGLIE